VLGMFVYVEIKLPRQAFTLGQKISTHYRVRVPDSRVFAGNIDLLGSRRRPSTV